MDLSEKHPSTVSPSLASDKAYGYTNSKRSFFHQRTAHRHYIVGLLRRMATLMLIMVVLIGLGLGLQYTNNMPTPEDFSRLTFDWRNKPGSYLVPFNQSFQFNVLLDGHSHSTYSDGKMTVRQLLDWHIANGYNAVIVTDHNSVAGGLAAEKLALEEYKDRIVVIPGMEYTCCRIHMNFIDINETVPSLSASPTDEEMQAAIRRVHDLGGLVIVNHIPWSNTTGKDELHSLLSHLGRIVEYGYQMPRLPDHPSVAELISWGVDGFEVVHQDTFDYPTFQETQKNNLVQMVGTDVHHPSVAANVWLAVNASRLDRQAIMNEIRARRTSFLFDPAGTAQRSYPGASTPYAILTPLTWLGNYFGMFYTDVKGMYSFHGSFCHPEQLTVHGNVIGWFIFWLLIFVLFFELTRSLCILATSRMMKRN